MFGPFSNLARPRDVRSAKTAGILIDGCQADHNAAAIDLGQVAAERRVSVDHHKIALQSKHSSSSCIYVVRYLHVVHGACEGYAQANGRLRDHDVDMVQQLTARSRIGTTCKDTCDLQTVEPIDRRGAAQEHR